MKSYQPPYKITSEILALVAQICETIANTNLVEIQNSPQLRKQNRIKTIAGTLAIEGNTLGCQPFLMESPSEVHKGRLPRYEGQLKPMRAWQNIKQIVWMIC